MSQPLTSVSDKYPVRGIKHDTGKATYWRALRRFPRAIAAASAVADFGFEKYCRHTGLPDDNWQHVVDAERRYFDALVRHWVLIQGGELTDPESGLPHWAHFCWNALALSEMELGGAE